MCPYIVFVSLGENIRRLRRERQWTQIELGSRIGVDQRLLTCYERNTATPPLERILKIAEVFQVSLDELAGRKELKSAKRNGLEPRRSRRVAKIEKLFGDLPANEQRSLLKLVETYVKNQRNGNG